MHTIVTMARETFSQAIRMRIAVAFILVLACALGALPFVMSGDGTLAGEIQTFLSYSLGLSGVLLGLVVILVSARIVSRDIDDRTIFLVAVKPMARWQYLLGRWLGMVALITVLLGIAACASYFTSAQMRTRPAVSALDRQAVEMEIFTARDSIRPEPLPIHELIEARIAEIKKRGEYAEVVDELRRSRGIGSRFPVRPCSITRWLKIWRSRQSRSMRGNRWGGHSRMCGFRTPRREDLARWSG
jgi:hypothetical protein